jgi:anti-sigma-K factor RskA
MNHTSNGHERWSEELAAYLLGALDPAEAAAFERHAEGCERCRTEARWLAPAMQALPESVERLEPPAELRDRLMTEVRAEAAERPVRRRRFVDLWRGGGRPRALRPLAGLAVLALLVAAVAGYLVGSDGSSGPSPTVTSGQAPGVVAEMVSAGEGGSLRLSNVEPLPEGKVLEAWVEREGEVEAVPALFAPDEQGRATTTVEDMSGVETVMVTVEPAGGSDEPTSKPILTMSVPG